MQICLILWFRLDFSFHKRIKERDLGFDLDIHHAESDLLNSQRFEFFSIHLILFGFNGSTLTMLHLDSTHNLSTCQKCGKCVRTQIPACHWEITVLYQVFLQSYAAHREGMYVGEGVVFSAKMRLAAFDPCECAPCFYLQTTRGVVFCSFIVGYYCIKTAKKERPCPLFPLPIFFCAKQ